MAHVRCILSCCVLLTGPDVQWSDTLASATDLLRRKYHIHQTTIQVEDYDSSRMSSCVRCQLPWWDCHYTQFENVWFSRQTLLLSFYTWVAPGSTSALSCIMHNCVAYGACTWSLMFAVIDIKDWVPALLLPTDHISMGGNALDSGPPLRRSAIPNPNPNPRIAALRNSGPVPMHSPPSVCPSARVFPLYLWIRPTVDLKLLRASRSWP